MQWFLSLYLVGAQHAPSEKYKRKKVMLNVQIKTSHIFHWAINTFNKTFSLRKEAQNRGKNLSQKL